MSEATNTQRYKALLDWPNRDCNILVWSMLGPAPPSRRLRGGTVDVYWRCRVIERATGAQGNAKSRNFQVAIVVATMHARRHAQAYRLLGLTTRGEA